MHHADVARLRLTAQCISTTAFHHPRELVAWLGAVQAQDYLGALWAVGLRLTGARSADVEGALADGSVVRTWPMRGTLHLVAAADARWILELLGPKSIAGAAGRFRALGIDDATLARARRTLVARLEHDGRLSRTSVYQVLERAKIATGGQRGVHILWRLAHERLLCFGPREGKQQTLVLFDEWVKGARRLARDEALGELARRYFTSHGPATMADFAWWSGLKVSDARAAIHLAEGHLSKETLAEHVHWFADVPVRPPAPRRRAFLLPAFDEFVVGYADRTAALRRGQEVGAIGAGGMLNPAIVVDDRIVGTWKRTVAGRAVVFVPSLFAPLSKPRAQAVVLALRRYADFLGLDVRGER
jgi:hypothetical protein